MNEKDVYIGETSIQIGQHGFINQPKEIIEYIKYLQKELQQKENIIKEAKDYIRSKSIKFTMAYVEDYGRIDLSRSDYRIDKLTSKQVKELLEILDKE